MSSSGNTAVGGRAQPTFVEITAGKTLGPEIWNNESFTAKNYGEKASNTKEIQGDELPSEWWIQASSGWSKETKLTWRVGLFAIIVAFLPFVLTISLFVLSVVRWSEPYWLVWLSDILNNPWVSGILNVVATFLAITIIQRTWNFVSNEIFRKSKSEKQVWVGAGTTAIRVGELGLSIKTPRSIFALDWTAIESCNVLVGYTYRKKRVKGRTYVEQEDAVRLNLRSIGENKGTSTDVLIVPKRFFDDESQISWNSFIETVNRRISK